MGSGGKKGEEKRVWLIGRELEWNAFPPCPLASLSIPPSGLYAWRWPPQGPGGKKRILDAHYAALRWLRKRINLLRKMENQLINRPVPVPLP